MARRRRKPLSLIAWLLGVIISVSGAYIIYQVRVATIENMAQRQIERSHAAIQKIQQQQQARRQLAAPQPMTRPEERAVQHERAVAARLRQAEVAEAARAKEEAWNRYYQPPKACICPESVSRTLACEASERKTRRQFEAAWANGQLQTHQEQQGYASQQQQDTKPEPYFMMRPTSQQ